MTPGVISIQLELVLNQNRRRTGLTYGKSLMWRLSILLTLWVNRIGPPHYISAAMMAANSSSYLVELEFPPSCGGNSVRRLHVPRHILGRH